MLLVARRNAGLALSGTAGSHAQTADSFGKSRFSGPEPIPFQLDRTCELLILATG
jgi:hypothetical protein